MIHLSEVLEIGNGIFRFIWIMMNVNISIPFTVRIGESFARKLIRFHKKVYCFILLNSGRDSSLIKVEDRTNSGHVIANPFIVWITKFLKLRSINSKKFKDLAEVGMSHSHLEYSRPPTLIWLTQYFYGTKYSWWNNM